MNTELDLNFPDLSEDFLTCNFQVINSLEEQDSLQKPEPLLKGSKKIHKDKTYTESLSTQSSSCSPPTKTNINNNYRSYWTQEEDEQVIELYETFGPQWAKLASIMKTRTRKQIRDRYLNFLRPDIKNTEWTQEEEAQLAILHEKYGNKWCKIAAEMPGRTENQIKNKFHTPIKLDRLRKLQRFVSQECKKNEKNLPYKIESCSTDGFFSSSSEDNVPFRLIDAAFKDSFVDIDLKMTYKFSEVFESS